METRTPPTTDDILNSFDKLQRAQVPPFFYTRLKARMEKGLEPETPSSWLLRPVYALSALIVVLAINAYVIFGKATSNDNNNTSMATTEGETMQSLASDFSLNDNSTLLGFNQDAK
jgi:hypothetical protein